VLRKNNENYKKSVEIATPDIAGNLGYPPRFEPSYEMVKVQ
jgi:hypothetical protein